jgi:acetylornithine deacetylase/succinyl-diaminopimelate desuccinylase-like protein
MSAAPTLLDTARELLAAPSENPPGDERVVADTVIRLLADRGIDAVRQVYDDLRRPNVLAELRGRASGPRLALCGHLDTKPVGELAAWAHDPFAGDLVDGILYGLGAADMKGAVAAMIVALGRVLDAGGLSRGSVVLVLCADEEGGSSHGALALATHRAVSADGMVIGEPSGLDHDWDSIGVTCRGSMLFRIELTTDGGHSSLQDRGGAPSATVAAVRLATALREEFERFPGCAVNVPATISGGTGYGVTASECHLRGDIRLAPGLALAVARAALERVIDQFDATGVEVRVIDNELGCGGFDAAGVEESSAIAHACRDACADVLGREVPFAVFPGGTDAYAFQGVSGIPTVPALGPGRLREAHHPNEHVSVRSLEQAVGVYERVIRRFCEGL